MVGVNSIYQKLGSLGSRIRSCFSRNIVYPNFLRNTKESTHVVTDLYNAPNQYNVIRHAGNSARFQTYNKSGRLLGTTRYPYNDNAKVSTSPNGLVRITRYQNGIESIEQANVKNLTEFVSFMRPRYSSIFNV